MSAPARIFFIAGENSGDQRAANVVRHIKRMEPEWDLAGLGGPQMESAGMRLVRNMVDDMAIVGFVEVLSKAPTIWKVYQTVKAHLVKEKPDAVVLVDYPGFNLGLIAPLAQKLGIKVIYYVIPQVWAWHRGRIQKFKKYCDKLLPIFPFEEKLLRQEGIDASYLGHPLLDMMNLTLDREGVCRRFELDPSKKIIGLLPGSRKREIRSILPIMLEAAQRLLAERDDLQFILPRSASIPLDLIDSYVEPSGVPLTVADSNRLNIRAALDFSWVKSGTSTLEAALLGAPFVIIYKVNYITGWIARRLLSIPFLGMPNIVAGDLVVPELLQEQATAQNLADYTQYYLNDERANENMRYQLRKIREAFGPAGSSRRTAEAIIDFLKPKAEGEQARAESDKPGMVAVDIGDAASEESASSPGAHPKG